MSNRSYYVGIDLGGQSIKAGVVDESGQPLTETIVVPTESAKGQEHGLNQMCRAVRAATEAAGCSLEAIQAIGVATPGLMDIPAGIMTEPVNFPGWRNVPVRDHIARTFNKPTAFQNDANAAAFGEFWAGSGKGSKSLVLFTLGTGIGCGIVWDGKIIEGEHSCGAEVGHMVVQALGGRPCGCGRFGCLEAYASETALLKMVDEALATAPPGSILRAEMGKRRAAGSLFAAAAQLDPLAERIVGEAAWMLAVGATNMMHTIDPDCVVFGGGMSLAAGSSFLARIAAATRTLAFPVPAARTRIAYASLAEKAGYIGAAGWAKQLHGS